MTIGLRIKELRIEKDMGQEELAKGLQISRSALSHYEVGLRQVPNWLIPKIAKFFNVSTDYLFGLED